MATIDVIWKFTLSLAPGSYDVPMPDGARVLSCGVQSGHSVVLWAACDPKTSQVSRLIHVRMTGQDAPAAARFIGTCLIDEGAYVLHVFEGQP